MLLAFDTSTASVTVCVHDEVRGELLAERNAIGPMQHGELLAPAIVEVMTEARISRRDLTAIVVGVGPGPYTGLRVGVVTARTLAFTLGLPVHGICSLDAVALAAVEAGTAEEFVQGFAQGLVVTTDARRKELFWAEYDGQGQRLEGPFVDKPGDIPVGGRPVAGAGPGLYPGIFDRVVGPQAPTAGALARLASRGSTELLAPVPIYLRKPDAVAPGKPKKVS